MDIKCDERNVEQRNPDNFIMLPTVDFCFKELMKNPKVRQGFVAAILGRDPKTIRQTQLMNTELHRELEDDKLGILDVLIELDDGSWMNMEMQVPYFQFWANRVLFYVGKTYTGQIQKGDDNDKLQKCIHVSILDFIHFPQDQKCYRKITFCDTETGEQYTDLMELHILELKKLPPQDRNENGIIRWMRFLGGKKQEEFEMMAKQDEYIEEAYGELKKLSLDEQKRLEYEWREKAIRDYNTQMHSAEKRGERLALKRLVGSKVEKGMSEEVIADLLEIDVKLVMELKEEWKKEQKG